MKTYVSLLTFTKQGANNLKQSPKRSADFRKAAEKVGVEVVMQLWTAGAYDGILILRGESEEKVLGLLVGLVALGNVRTHSLRAFEADEWKAMLPR